MTTALASPAKPATRWTATPAAEPAARPAGTRPAWNDIEALPLHAAALLLLLFLFYLFADIEPTMRSEGLKAVGIFGALALRQAWLRLDEDQRAGG